MNKMPHNYYGSEKGLNCTQFGGTNNNNAWASSYQQDPNVNSWLDYNYNYNLTHHTQNVDYILNFEENHNNAQSQYYHQQQQNITEYNYDLPLRCNTNENHQQQRVVTNDNNNNSNDLPRNLSGSLRDGVHMY